MGSTGKKLYTARQFIIAIPGTGGIISKIAERVGCQWHTAKKYIYEFPTIKQVYDNECERIIDLAESALIKSITEQESWAVKYYLSTKGKSRGYIEHQELKTDGEFVLKVVYGNKRSGTPDSTT